MPMVRRQVPVVVAVGVLFLALSSPARAQTPAPPPRPAPVPRVADVRGVHLRAGEAITFALHPNEVPISVRAGSDAPLEACPSTLDGAGPESGDSSWPSATGFVACIPFHATVQLPSTQSGLYHLAFLIRGVGGHAATIPRLRVTYTPVDSYFEVLPPTLPPGVRSPGIAVVPASERTVGVRAFGLIELPTPPGVRASVTQRGRRVPKTRAVPPGEGTQGFGPVRVHAPVRVVVTNGGRDPAQIRIAVAWV